MSKVRRYFKGLSFNIISAVVVLILVFSLIVSAVGYICFTNTLKREYKETTYNMTKTAAALVTGNKIQEYIASDDESGYSYATTKSYLYDYCNKMDVTIVHVIGDIDTETFKSAKTIFNLINDKNNYEITGKKGDYTPWNLNDPFEEPYISSYSEIYEQIYNREIEFGTVYRTKDLRGKDPHITSIVPINDSKGNIVAILSIQRPMKELVEVEDLT